MKYIACGRIHPERAAVNIPFTEWNSDEVSYSFWSHESQFIIKIDDPSIDGSVSAHLTTEHLTQMIVNSLGFKYGAKYTPEIIQVISEDDDWSVPGVKLDELHLDGHEIIGRTLDASRVNLHFRFAVRDYLAAITESIDCPFLCYRAIESVAKKFSTSSGNTNWNPMHSALGTKKEDINSLAELAKTIRHGNWGEFKSTTQQQRVEILLLTRKIILLYLEHIESYS